MGLNRLVMLRARGLSGVLFQRVNSASLVKSAGAFQGLAEPETFQVSDGAGGWETLQVSDGSGGFEDFEVRS